MTILLKLHEIPLLLLHICLLMLTSEKHIKPFEQNLGSVVSLVGSEPLVFVNAELSDKSSFLFETASPVSYCMTGVLKNFQQQQCTVVLMSRENWIGTLDSDI